MAQHDSHRYHTSHQEVASEIEEGENTWFDNIEGADPVYVFQGDFCKQNLEKDDPDNDCCNKSNNQVTGITDQVTGSFPQQH